MTLKKKQLVRIKKKKKERGGGVISCLWHWTGQEILWLLQHDI